MQIIDCVTCLCKIGSDIKMQIFLQPLFVFTLHCSCVGKCTILQVWCNLFALWWNAMYNVQHAMCNVQCAMCNVRCATVCSSMMNYSSNAVCTCTHVQWNLLHCNGVHSTHCTVLSVQCSEFSVQCTLCSVQCRATFSNANSEEEVQTVQTVQCSYIQLHAVESPLWRAKICKIAIICLSNGPECTASHASWFNNMNIIIIITIIVIFIIVITITIIIFIIVTMIKRTNQCYSSVARRLGLSTRPSDISIPPFYLSIFSLSSSSSSSSSSYYKTIRHCIYPPLIFCQ